MLLRALFLDSAHEMRKTRNPMRPVFEPVLDFVVAHRELCAMLIENNKASRFIEHLQQMIRGKFRILDDARTITVGERYAITLSIGVGHGASTLEESEAMAVQALDMALGRGGDQVALKTENGYKFFGGVSKGVEKKSRAKTRIIANAMQELIHTCDRVMIMGHRYGDLDSIGSAIGLAGAILQSGKPAHVVVDRQTTLAGVLIDRMEAEDIHLTIDVPTALTQMTEQTLLIVVDTHSKDFVESVDLYQNARQVVTLISYCLSQ